MRNSSSLVYKMSSRFCRLFTLRDFRFARAGYRFFKGI